MQKHISNHENDPTFWVGFIRSAVWFAHANLEANGNGKRPKPNEDPDKNPGGGKKPKSNVSKLNETLSVASKLKVRYLSTVTAARELIDMVASEDESWQWAANEQNIGKLTKLLAKLEQSLSKFGKDFLVTSAKDLKTRMKESALQVGLDGFVDIENHWKRSRSTTRP